VGKSSEFPSSATDMKPTKKRSKRKRLPDNDGSNSVQMDVSEENKNNLEPTEKDSESSTVTVTIK
jgi:hypothetical protein